MLGPYSEMHRAYLLLEILGEVYVVLGTKVATEAAVLSLQPQMDVLIKAKNIGVKM